MLVWDLSSVSFTAMRHETRNCAHGFLQPLVFVRVANFDEEGILM